LINSAGDNQGFGRRRMLEATGEPSVVLASLYLRAIKVAKAVDLDAETWPFRELSSRGDRTE